MDLGIQGPIDEVSKVPGSVERVVPPGHLEVLHQGLDLVVLDVPVEVPEGHDGVREGVDPINICIVRKSPLRPFNRFGKDHFVLARLTVDNSLVAAIEIVVCR